MKMQVSFMRGFLKYQDKGNTQLINPQQITNVNQYGELGTLDVSLSDGNKIQILGLTSDVFASKCGEAESTGCVVNLYD